MVCAEDTHRSTTATRLRKRVPMELAGLLSVLAICLFAFRKTLFAGKSLSNVYCVPEWDSAFDAFRTGVASSMDPSSALLFVPTLMLSARTWLSGHLPLWNPDFGLGSPLVADIQGKVFSPMTLGLCLVPSLEFYSIELAVLAILGVLSAYVLMRVVGLSWWSSAPGALSYGFCPYILHYSEIMTGGFGMMPAVFAALILAARHRTALTVVVSAVLCALFVFLAHPEIALFGISFATLSAIGLSMLEQKDKTMALSQAALAVACVAALSLGFAAPMLLPFIEYLQNCESYKFTVAASAYIPWQALAYNLLHPAASGASPFLGALAVPLSLLSLADRRCRWLWALALLSLAFAVQAGPLHDLFTREPMSYLMTIYALPVFLLLTATLIAFGLEALAALESKPLLYAFIVVAISLAAVPGILHAQGVPIHYSFDSTLPVTAFMQGQWLRDMTLTILSLLFLWISLRRGWRASAAALVCGAVLLFSQSFAASKAMPQRPAFLFPQTRLTEFLRQDGGRIVSTGDHLLRPNSHFILGLRQITVINAMWPARMGTYLESCGARIGQYGQSFGTHLLRPLDLCGVKYVVSQMPVVADEEEPGQPLTVDGLDRPLLIGGMKLKAAKLKLDRANLQVTGELQWDGTGGGGIAWRPVVFRASNDAIWFGDQVVVGSACGKQMVGWCIPSGAKQEEVRIGLQFVNLENGQLIVRQSSPAWKKGLLQLAQLDASLWKQPVATGKRHYTLVREEDSWIRVYQNNRALPEAYVAYSAIHADSAGEALATISSREFDPWRLIVLEGGCAPAPHNQRKIEPAFRLLRPSASKVVIECEAAQSGFVVLSDQFYPGWQARVDGKPVEILRCNYLFRAVPVSAGTHQVEFSYDPIPFKWGCWLALGSATVSLLAILRELRKAKGQLAPPH